MSSKIHILLLIVYVFASFLHSEGSTSVHPTLSDICKKTGSVDLCVSTIAPGLNGREADASSVLKEAIRVAATRFAEAKKLADKLAHEANTPRGLVNALNVCSGIFDETLFSLEEIPRAIDDRSDPQGLNMKLSGIKTDASTCITTLHEGSTLKSALDPVASELSKLGSLCLEISTQLLNSKDVAGTFKAKGTTAPVHPTLSDICKKTGKADLCISTIAPGLNGREADASSALKEAIKVTRTKFKEAKKFADKLAHDATTHRGMISALDSCKDDFNEAAGRLKEALRAIDHPVEPNELNFRLSSISSLADSCTYVLHEEHTETSPLDPVASELSQLGGLCSDIETQLGKSKDVARTCKAKGTTAPVHPTLSDICKKTGEADLCISTIASGFNGREADASSALKEAIKVVATRFAEAKKLADKLAHEANTPRGLVNALNVCSGLFDETLFSLKEIPRAIDDRSDPQGLNIKLSGIKTDASTCITTLHEGSTVKSPLDPVASELSKLGSLCLHISTQIPA